MQNKKWEIKNEKSVSDRLFPIPLLEKDSLDFSFSGLKSAALREIQERIQNWEFRIENWEKLAEEDINEICFEYRESICLVLLEKIQRAMKQYDTEQLYLVGWVSANARLRELLDEKEKQGDMHYLTPALLTYCGDNAAMVGITAYYQNSTK